MFCLRFKLVQQTIKSKIKYKKSKSFRIILIAVFFNYGPRLKFRPFNLIWYASSIFRSLLIFLYFFRFLSKLAIKPNFPMSCMIKSKSLWPLVYIGHTDFIREYLSSFWKTRFKNFHCFSQLSFFMILEK